MFQNIKIHRREVKGGSKNGKVTFFPISNTISWFNNAEKGLIKSFNVHRPKPSGLYFGEGKKIQVTVAFTLLLNLVQPEQCCSDSIP